jgi:hypothetical protein
MKPNTADDVLFHMIAQVAPEVRMMDACEDEEIYSHDQSDHAFFDEERVARILRGGGLRPDGDKKPRSKSWSGAAVINVAVSVTASVAAVVTIGLYTQKVVLREARLVIENAASGKVLDVAHGKQVWSLESIESRHKESDRQNQQIAKPDSSNSAAVRGGDAANLNKPEALERGRHKTPTEDASPSILVADRGGHPHGIENHDEYPSSHRHTIENPPVMSSDERIALICGISSYDGNRDACWRSGLQPASVEAQQAINMMLRVAGIKKTTRAYIGPVENAAAAIVDTDRAIVYNPEFFQSLYKKTNNKWAVISVLAHSLSHHTHLDTVASVRIFPDAEFRADLFSGRMMRQLGATLDDALVALRTESGSASTSTHPANESRIQAITSGYNSPAKDLTPASVNMAPRFAMAERPGTHLMPCQHKSACSHQGPDGHPLHPFDQDHLFDTDPAEIGAPPIDVKCFFTPAEPISKAKNDPK